MRRLHRVAATAAITLTLAVGLTTPALAAEGDVEREVEGSAGDNRIRARAGAYPGRAGPSYTCDWERVWPESNSVIGGIYQTLNRLLTTFGPFDDDIFSEYFDQDEIRLIDRGRAEEIRAEADEAGERARVFQSLPDAVAGNDTFIHVQNGKDSFLDQFFLLLRGGPDLGSRIDLEATTQVDGDIDALRAGFPVAQRGSTTDGDELWWDPYYVAGDAVDDQCPAMVFYSPRERDPSILLPDVLAESIRLLPPAEAVVTPIDERHGWAYVQVPTDFGVDDGSLEQQIAHAQVEFIDPDDPSGSTDVLWAQVVADPVAIVFHPGDGRESVSCPVRDMRFDPADPGPCSYVYLDSSNIEAGKVFRAEIEVIWVGRYTSSEGDDENLGIIATTSQFFDLPVAEARAAASVGT